MNDIELKPCPFCGGEAKLKKDDAFGITVYVKCEMCGALTRPVQVSPDYCANDKAAEAWNRRADNG